MSSSSDENRKQQVFVWPQVFAERPDLELIIDIISCDPDITGKDMCPRTFLIQSKIGQDYAMP